MSEEKYRIPSDTRPGEVATPLVTTPGQLYPPAQAPPQRHSYHEHNDGDNRHDTSRSARGLPAPTTTVVVSQPCGAVPGNAARYRMDPVLIVCQFCNATVTTTVTDVRGLLQYVLTAVLCCVGCWLGCCLIPLFVNDLYDVKHTCPNCGQLTGKYAHMG